MKDFTIDTRTFLLYLNIQKYMYTDIISTREKKISTLYYFIYSHFGYSESLFTICEMHVYILLFSINSKEIMSRNRSLSHKIFLSLK